MFKLSTLAEAATKNNTKEWTQKDLSEFSKKHGLGVSLEEIRKHRAKLKKMGVVFLGESKKEAEKRTKSTMQKLLRLMKKKDKKIWTIEGLALYAKKQHLVTSSGVIKKHQGIFEKEGYTFLSSKQKIIEGKILSLLEILEEEATQKWSLSGLEKLSRNHNIPMCRSSIKKNRETLEKEGVVIEGTSFQKKKEYSENELEKLIALAQKDTEKEWTLYALYQFAEAHHIDVSMSVVYSREGLFVESGLTIIKESGKEKRERTGHAISKLAEIAKKDGEKEWTICKLAKVAITHDLNIAESTIQSRQELLEENGIILVGESIKDKKARIKDALEKLVEAAKKHSEKEWTFAELGALAKDHCIDISETSIFTHKETIADGGVIMTEEAVRKKREYIDRKVEKLIGIAKKENAKEWTYVKLVELGKDHDISVTTIDISSRKNKLHEAGLLLKAEAQKLNRSLSHILSIIENDGIKLANRKALQEICTDFYGKSFRDNTINEATTSAQLFSDCLVDFDPIFQIETIQDVADTLLDSQSNFTVMELKFMLLSNGFYFSTEDIEMSLSVGGMYKYLIEDDDIYLRLRLVKLMVREGWDYIEYKESLPLINDSPDANIVIKRQIKDKKIFIKKWKEYVEFIIKDGLLGRVSKRKVSPNWNGDTSTLPRHYQEAFLLGIHEEDLLELGYEGLSILSVHNSRSYKNNLPEIFQGLYSRVSGFFMWLSSEGLALSHPKAIRFTGGGQDKLNQISETLAKKLPLLKAYEDLFSKDTITKTEKNKLQASGVNIHLLQLAFSVSTNANLCTIPKNSIFTYCENAEYYATSGNRSHTNIVLSILWNLGNKAATKTEIQFEVKSYFEEKSTYIGSETLRRYKTLIADAISIISFRLEENEISMLYAKSHVGALVFLLEFLDNFDWKLSKAEMEKALNPIIENNTILRIKDYAKEKNCFASYRAYTSKYRMLFEEFDSGNAYFGIYSEKWILHRKAPVRTIIREAYEPIILKEYLEVLRSCPPGSVQYPFPRHTADGLPINLDWWKHDMSPIPVMAVWLLGKIPLRGIQIRSLDLDSFMRYDENTGKFMGMYINTDKNKDRKTEHFIRKELVYKIFLPDEIKLIEDYICYVKEAYPLLERYEYENGGSLYDPILPLFPRHDEKGIIAKQIFQGYYNKTIFLTEQKVHEQAREGAYAENYNLGEREHKSTYLAEKQLLFLTGSGEKQGVQLPKTRSDLDARSESAFSKLYTTLVGLHNMRHTGITNLLRSGWNINNVMAVSGHEAMQTTLMIYTHLLEDDLVYATSIIAPDIENIVSDSIQNGQTFIQKTLYPMIESGNYVSIEKMLKRNGLMSKPNTITSDNKDIYGATGEIYVDNGLQIASKNHPYSLWELLVTGICTLKGGCPSGLNRRCGLCPHLLFSGMHINGINYKIGELTRASVINANLMLDSKKSGKNVTRSELEDFHENTVRELMAWMENLKMAEAQIEEVFRDKSKTDSQNLPMKNKEEPIVVYREVPLDHAAVDILSMAANLNVKNHTTESLTKEVTLNLVMAAANKKDFGLIERLREDGVDWFVSAYGKKAIGEKTGFLNQYLDSSAREKNPLLEVATKRLDT